MADLLTGSCLCGAVRYSIAAPVSELRACHCTHCQKASGAGGSVNAVVPSAAFRIEQGSLKRHDAAAASGRTLHRYFCGDCGSPIYSQRPTMPDFVVVRAGTIDDAPDAKITLNIWTRSARSWSYIDPASKQVEGQP